MAGGLPAGSASIRWPARFRPEQAPVHVRNESDIPVPPIRVWHWLVRASLWPSWYRNSSGVALEGGGPDLSPGSRFRWKTFGVGLTSQVAEFLPPERLAWTGRSFGVDVYHTWLISVTSTGCHVLTEESQYGFLARLDHRLRPRRMASMHQVWLDSLRDRAAGGPPPEAAQP
jgi:uncharacterized protein YndB with AHSA1/START domain